MTISKAMRQLIPVGSYVLFLFFLAGVWLAMSPFAMQSQPSNQHWIASTTNSVVVGAILMVVSLVGIVGYMLFALRDLARDARIEQEAKAVSVK